MLIKGVQYNPNIFDDHRFTIQFVKTTNLVTNFMINLFSYFVLISK
jgi:hypothetical protein